MQRTKEYIAKYQRKHYLANKEKIDNYKKERLDNNIENNRKYQREYKKIQKIKECYLRINKLRSDNININIKENLLNICN